MLKVKSVYSVQFARLYRLILVLTVCKGPFSVESSQNYNCAICIFRDSFEEDIVVELYRLLHGTAGRLHILMDYNKALRSTIQAVSNVILLTLKAPTTTAADDIHQYFFIFFSEKIRLDISCESSARQKIHMKFQA